MLLFSCLQLDAEMLEKIPILKKLRALEQKAGKDVTLKVCSAKSSKTKQERKPELKLCPDPKHNTSCDPEIPRQDRMLPYTGSGEEADTKREPSQAPVSTLYLGGLPAGLRVSELKGFLRERGALPVRLTWQGAQHRAFLDYGDQRTSDQALDSLQGLCINGHTLYVERARSQKSSQKPGAPKDPSRTNPNDQARLEHPRGTSQRRVRRKNPEKGVRFQQDKDTDG